MMTVVISQAEGHSGSQSEEKEEDDDEENQNWWKVMQTVSLTDN